MVITAFRFVKAVTFLQQLDGPAPERSEARGIHEGDPRITAKDLSKRWRFFETYALL
jgi:hypothetical protein